MRIAASASAGQPVPPLLQGLRELDAMGYGMAPSPHSTRYGTHHGPEETYRALEEDPGATILVHSSSSPLFTAGPELLGQPGRLAQREKLVRSLSETYLMPLVQEDRLPRDRWMPEYARFFQYVLDGDHGLEPDQAARRLTCLMRVEPRQGGPDDVGRTPVKDALEDLERVKRLAGKDLDQGVKDLAVLMAYFSRRPAFEQLERLWGERRALCFSQQAFDQLREQYFRLLELTGSIADAEHSFVLLDVPFEGTAREERSRLLEAMIPQYRPGGAERAGEDYMKLLAYRSRSESLEDAAERLRSIRRCLPPGERRSAGFVFAWVQEGVRQGCFRDARETTRDLLDQMLQGHDLDAAMSLVRGGAGELSIEREGSTVRVGGVPLPIRAAAGR
ncbi:MAG: hypothetical protein HY319_31505 [Armatimonadetes bacterium]|nr:hypothetical protein [Armatimonadota bacterium]